MQWCNRDAATITDVADLPIYIMSKIFNSADYEILVLLLRSYPGLLLKVCGFY